jgi:hypothetical protein
MTKTLAIQIAKRLYPDWRGRKFKLEHREKVLIADYWDGGSRHYAVGYALNTGGTTFQPVQPDEKDPFHRIHGTYTLTPNTAIVEHIIFCGKDLGCRMYVHPSVPIEEN